MLLHCACAGGAQAADWVRVGTPDQHQHFYDRSKLVIDGEQITYWRTSSVPHAAAGQAGMARMAMYRERIDCAKHTYRTLGYLLYAQDGAHSRERLYARGASRSRSFRKRSATGSRRSCA